ncbi:MAG: acyl-CoA dehydrogenase family protein [Pseudomonadota bacterium]
MTIAPQSQSQGQSHGQSNGLDAPLSQPSRPVAHPPHRPRTRLDTHEVGNQPEPRGDRDLWAEDGRLQAAVTAAAADYSADVAAYGAEMGRAETREDGRLANRHGPELRVFDAGGRRIDEVSFHPAYHAMMRRGLHAGYAACAWEEDGRAGGHVAHTALMYLASQVEPGSCCPMTMTYAAQPAVRADEGIAALWGPRLNSRAYDGRSRPVTEKTGATLGMAMTEKQGGSDVRSNTTRAEPDGADWRLYGHKWFCSAPMSDGFLTLAHTEAGLTCFLVPRWTPDGERNAIHLMRLKDKLGNRSNASSEIEYHGAWAQALGAPGDGVRTIVEMVHHTRLDTATAPVAFMRAALSEAVWWCRERRAFQKTLIDQPLMAAVLADIALDWEGGLALVMRVAAAFDAGQKDPEARAFARLSVALAKYALNKRCANAIYEAMECLGGAGYVEESPLPLLYREAPLNSIWEGSGNVICLDVLRTLRREPASFEMLRAELAAAKGVDRRYDAALEAAERRWPRGPEEAEARWFVERYARLLEASLLLREGAPAVSEAFVAARLGEDRGAGYGAVGSGADTAAILARI